MLRKGFFAVLAAIALIYFAAVPPSQSQIIGGSVRTHNHSSNSQGGATLGTHTVTGTLTTSNVSVGGTITSTRACAAGYQRVSPNLCMVLARPAYTNIPAACTGVLAPSVDARAIVLDVLAQINTANAVGIRSTTVFLYSDSVCTTTRGSVAITAREEIATPAVALAQNNWPNVIVMPSVSPGGAIAVELSGTAAFYAIVGYYD